MRHKKGSVIAVICTILGIICVVYGVFQLYPEWRIQNASRKLQEKVILNSEDAQAEKDEAMYREIDWEALRELNPDIIGWVYIPGTQIDYPVLRHDTDINYYLNHTYDKQYNFIGSIFVRPEQKSLQDSHVILFGHNTVSGCMFGEISRYETEEFAVSHPIYIYTLEDVRKYEVFSSYECQRDDATYLLELEREQFLQNTAKNPDKKYFRKEKAEKYGRFQLLTISTCPNYDSWGKRFVVQCLRTDIRRYGDA